MASSIPLPCDELRQLYEDERLTTVQLGARYNCSPATISNRLRRCGVRLRDARYRALHIPAGELRRLYLEEGRSVVEIARHFGVSSGTIYNRCRAYGLPTGRGRRAAGRLIEAAAALYPVLE
jgi:DNA-directed RNA polymerase specialized sigma24 family protein